MGKLVLLTGGARSGKSSIAEKMAREALGGCDGDGDNVLYIATSIPFDDEMKERVKKHKEQRPKSWNTFEGYRNLGAIFKSLDDKYGAVLLDCITIMITNLMFDYLGDKMEEADSKEFSEAENFIMKEIADLLKGIKTCSATAILVTNEVGCGIVPENKLARHYRDIAGRVNAAIACAADEVYMAVCGCKLKVK